MTLNPFASLTEVAAALARGEVSAQSLAAFYLDRIRRANAKLNAFVDVTRSWRSATRAPPTNDAQAACGWDRSTACQSR